VVIWVTLAWQDTSSSARVRRLAPPHLGLADGWGQLTRGPQLPAPAGALHRVHPTFSAADFKGNLEKWIFRNYVNALENHNLLILTLKMVK
jgi:hypothetical protein